MASIVLGTIGRSVGSSLGGSVAAAMGQRVGQLVGSFVDARSGRSSRKREVEGASLEDLAVQTSTYGRVIPRVYGTARVAGNVIWARPIKETQTTTTTTTETGGKGGGGGGGSSETVTETSYSYSASVAVAVCEGQIASVERIWADAKLLSLGQYTIRIYKGTETQLTDALIESYEGQTTAFRGLAYVVFEDFPLADFGNRIPNFTFEVRRSVPDAVGNGQSAEDLVTSVMIIPGSGEYVYDSKVQSKIVGEQVGGQWVQRGNQVTLNMHNVQNVANMKLAIDQLQATFPNLAYVGVVVNWFASSLDANAAVIEPCVEFDASTRVSPDEWQVAGKTRATARVIGRDGDVARYGGTPSDSSVMNLLQELYGRGLQIFFYPMILVDVPGKPWRGHMTCTPAQVANFFTKSNGYNAFIMHYAQMTTGWVHAFAIGSELKALTAITSGGGVFPAVTQLVSLAASVRATMPVAKLTYAADWSEYHHTEGGWYHLDPLWASPNIDMVGIDAYFPLTDAPQNGIDKQAIMDGWTSGEGYDWYYTDPARTTKANLQPQYAWKNIGWWWNNVHVNPNSVQTAWVPQSKKIWFTEYGFASVDGTTNQPNVFVDPTSSDSAFPRFSRGRVDFAIQRAAIEATESAWASTAMVEKKFLWTWDARPYPQWPDLLDVWADGQNWDTGHWVQGKLGIAQLGGAVRLLLESAGFSSAQIDVQELTDTLDGFVVSQRMSVREALEQLMMVYPFDLVESAGKLKALKRGRAVVAEIEVDECLPQMEGDQRVLIETHREQELELPREMEVVFLNRLNGYNAGTQRAFRHSTKSVSKHAMKVSVVLSDQQAKLVAERALAARWVERTRFTLHLPMRYATLEPCDVLRCVDAERSFVMRVEALQFGRPGMVRVQAVEDDAQLYESYISPAVAASGAVAPRIISASDMAVLDLPAMPADGAQDAKVRVAAVGLSAGWPGAAIYNLRPAGDVVLTRITTPSVMGRTSHALAAAEPQRVDYVNTLDVVLAGNGMLASATFMDVLNGANSAVVGDEIIQFTTAIALSAGKYRLSGLLRGRLGTEHAVGGHVAGERFVLLDGNVKTLPIVLAQRGSTLDLAPVTFGGSLDVNTAQSFVPQFRGLMPYAPVHVRAQRALNGDITLSWTRRTRLNGEWQDYQDVPLNEADERYDLEIYNGAQLIRSYRCAEPVQLYSATDQIVDFGSVQAVVHLKLYQLSALVGRGVAAEASV